MSADPAAKAIGMFDSGVGGLTVFRALAERLPQEHVVYLGDTARVPYGTKSPEIVAHYAHHCAALLLKRGIKLLIAACNTASAFGLEALRAELPVPVLGVIEPGAQRAAATTRNNRIGVIGTAGAIGSGQYLEALARHAPEARVFCRACPLFVPLAEEGWTAGVVPFEAARTYLSGLCAEGVDTLLLGCTHYPILEGVIGEVMGPGVELVDSAHALADSVEELLTAMDLHRPPADGAPASHEFLVTDNPAQFAETSQRFLGTGPVLAEWVAL